MTQYLARLKPAPWPSASPAERSAVEFRQDRRDARVRYPFAGAPLRSAGTQHTHTTHTRVRARAHTHIHTTHPHTHARPRACAAHSQARLCAYALRPRRTAAPCGPRSAGTHTQHTHTQHNTHTHTQHARTHARTHITSPIGRSAAIRAITMVAGGTGIAPMFQALCALFGEARAADERARVERVVLLFGVRRRAELLLREERGSSARTRPPAPIRQRTRLVPHGAPGGCGVAAAAACVSARRHALSADRCARPAQHGVPLARPELEALKARSGGRLELVQVGRSACGCQCLVCTLRPRTARETPGWHDRSGWPLGAYAPGGVRGCERPRFSVWPPMLRDAGHIARRVQRGHGRPSAMGHGSRAHRRAPAPASLHESECARCAGCRLRTHRKRAHARKHAHSPPSLARHAECSAPRGARPSREPRSGDHRRTVPPHAAPLSGLAARVPVRPTWWGLNLRLSLLCVQREVPCLFAGFLRTPATSPRASPARMASIGGYEPVRPE
jgi:hypothetical protein